MTFKSNFLIIFSQKVQSFSGSGTCVRKTRECKLKRYSKEYNLKMLKC